jgi:hypothetical protein
MERSVVIIAYPIFKKIAKDKQSVEVFMAVEQMVEASLDDWRAVAEMKIANEQRFAHT